MEFRTTATLMLALVMGLSGAASAAMVAYEQVDLGNGFYGTTIKLVDDENAASWAADLTVAGQDGAVINQLTASGDTVDLEVDAIEFDVTDPLYSKDLDTWVYAPFVPWAKGISEGANSYSAHVVSGPGLFETANCLHIVSTAGELAYSGIFARLGKDYPVEGTIPVGTVEETGTLGIFKFYDVDGDGEYDREDYPLADWEFTVTGGGLEDPLIVRTGRGGTVTVHGLASGGYIMREYLPEGWICTTGETIQTQYLGADGEGVASFQFGNVPEPTTMGLLALGGLAVIRRKRK